MIRNLIALICGFIISFLLISIVTFILINFKVYPFYDFVFNVKFGDVETFFKLGQKILYLNILIIFPIVSFTTSLISGLIAKGKEYVIGIISVIPCYIVFNVYPSHFSVDSIYALISFFISAVFGAYASEVIKRRKLTA